MRLGGRVRVVGLCAAFVGTLVVGVGTWQVPQAPADPTPVVSGHGIVVGASRWITGRTLEVDITTPAVGAIAVVGPHRVRITFPPTYAEQSTERFPVLYLLHGGAQVNSSQWTSGGGDVENITRNAQLITVMPDGGKVGWYTNWVDQSRGAQNWATFHLDQLIAWVDANFRTVAAKDGRAIAGLSMGGFGAIRYAQDRPDLFAYAASFSGALDLDDPRIRGTIMEESVRATFPPHGSFGNPFPPLDQGWRSLNPISRAARLHGVGIALYAGSGSNPFDQLERTVMESTERMHEALDAAGVPHFHWMYGRPGPSAPYGCDGGHNFGCWNFAFLDALPRMMAALRWPPPPPPPPPPPLDVERITNGGFESTTNAPWVCSGTCGVDRGLGFARSGSNNGWVRSNSGTHDIHQDITVTPNLTYTVSAWVRTSANNNSGAIGLRTPGGALVAQQTFGPQSGYTRVSATMNTGGNSSLVFFARLTASGDTWLRVDDVSVLDPRTRSVTSLVSSGGPSHPGEPVTFTATVSPAPAVGDVVTFRDGGSALGTATTDASGIATFTTSDLTGGPHAISAAYPGSADLAPSNSAVVTHVVWRSTAVWVGSSANPSEEDSAVTFSATVTPAPGEGETVTFRDGAATLGTGATTASGTATFTTSTLGVGSHAITADYRGNSSLLGSTSPALTQVVRARTTTSVESSVNPSVSGQEVAFTATVAPVPTGGGIVTFLDGASTLGTVMTDASGTATFTTSALAAGSHGITAAFAGDDRLAQSRSSELRQIVDPASTSTARVISSGQAPPAREGITFSTTVAAIAPGSGEPTGTVEFFDGATSLGTATLTAGRASLTTSALSRGNHSITAYYRGDSSFLASDSSASPFVQKVKKPATTTTSVSSSTNPSTVGDPVTFSTTVGARVPQPGDLPTGTVEFFAGSTSLGTATLVAGRASLTTNALPKGWHAVTAFYRGDSTFAPSDSGGSPLAQKVKRSTVPV